LESYFGFGSVYSKADAFPSALEQLVMCKKFTDAKEDFIHNKAASTKRGANCSLK
jgi:hypothetical protein